MKIKFKRGLVAGTLAMAFAFLTPFWSGCFGGNVTKDKATAKAVAENTQTVVNGMFNDAVKPSTASNEGKSAPLFSSAASETDFETGLFYSKEKHAVYANVMSVNLGLEMVKLVATKDSYTLNESFKNTITITDAQNTELKGKLKSTLKDNLNFTGETSYKCKMYFSESSNTLFYEILVTISGNDSYVKAEIAFDNDKKPTAYKAAAVMYDDSDTSPYKGSYVVAYFEGINYTDAKFLYARTKDNVVERYLLGPPAKIETYDANSTSSKKTLVNSYAKAMADMKADTTAKTIEGTDVFDPFYNSVINADGVVYTMEQTA